MSSDFGKFSIYDDRIIQARPAYGVYKGGESVTNTPFKAISQNSAQHTFNCNVPSPNIFVDRAVDWSSECTVSFMASVNVADAGIANDATAGNVPVITYGKDFALSAFPLHSLTQTMTATINDVVVSMNTQELLPQILRLTDYRKNLVQRTCPSMLDTYADYDDGFGSMNTPLNSYFESIAGTYATNGAYGRVAFCDPNNGQLLVGAGTYTFGGVAVWYNNGVPHCGNANPATGRNANLGAGLPIGLYFKSTEKLVLPPFIFADSKEMSTGLFGINAFQLLMNMVGSAGLQRVIRATSENNRTITANSVNWVANGFNNSTLNVVFITPSLALPLPAISSVPWMEFARYTSACGAIPAGLSQLQSNNIVLPCIPDYFMIFVKPLVSQYAYSDADYLLPITNINLQFNNFAGLMNSMTQEQLYHMSIQNGLEVDWNLFYGASATAPQNAVLNTLVRTCGAPLLIKPAKDFHLSQGLASGVNGNFNVQFNLTVDNLTGGTLASNTCLIYLVCINSGFFESHGGASRIIRAPINEADVINAQSIGAVGKQRLERMVGGGFWDKISSVINKASDIYKDTKPALSAIKNALPDSKVKAVLGKVGYGRAGKMKDRVVE
jgi:hypothetical protein